MKKALKEAPDISLPYGCVPKTIRFDRASFHKTIGLEMANRFLRNHPGRKGRLHLNPPRQPRANGVVERHNGECKRKLAREFLVDFNQYLKSLPYTKPSQSDVLVFLEDFDERLNDFLNSHNNKKKSGYSKSRIAMYREASPRESYEISNEEIDRNILYYEQHQFTGHGVTIDGIKYDGVGLVTHADRMLWVGIDPEGDSDVAYLFEGNTADNLKEIGILERCENSPLLSDQKQEQWNKDLADAQAANQERAKILKGIPKPPRAKRTPKPPKKSGRFEPAIVFPVSPIPSLPLPKPQRPSIKIATRRFSGRCLVILLI